MKNCLNENIKSLRIQFGMNQVEFAKKLNVTKQCVSNWENDNVQPSVEMLVKIADLFRISTDQLLGRSADQCIDVSCLTDEQCAHIRQIIGDFEKLNSNRH